MNLQEEQTFIKAYNDGVVSQEDFYKQYIRLIQSYVHRHTSQQNADDAIQEACILMFTIAKDYDASRGCKFTTFLLSKIRAVTTDFNRLSRLSSERFTSIETVVGDFDLEDPSSTIDEVSLDFSERFKRAISHLDKMEKDIIMMRYFQDMNYREIASKFGMLPASIQWREKKAIRKMKEELELDNLMGDIV